MHLIVIVVLISAIIGEVAFYNYLTPYEINNEVIFSAYITLNNNTTLSAVELKLKDAGNWSVDIKEDAGDDGVIRYLVASPSNGTGMELEIYVGDVGDRGRELGIYGDDKEVKIKVLKVIPFLPRETDVYGEFNGSFKNEYERFNRTVEMFISDMNITKEEASTLDTDAWWFDFYPDFSFLSPFACDITTLVIILIGIIFEICYWKSIRKEEKKVKVRKENE